MKRITTYRTQDIFEIFEPKAQEFDDAGGARILYTFKEDGTPERQRVGEDFELEILNPEQLVFSVHLPIVGPVQEGTITLLSPSREQVSDDREIPEALYATYSLDREDLEDLIFTIGTVMGLEDVDVILKLMTDKKQN